MLMSVFQWEQTEATGMGHTEMEDRREPAEGQRDAVRERPLDADTGNLGRESSALWAERPSTAEEQWILGDISSQETVGAGAAENMRLLFPLKSSYHMHDIFRQSCSQIQNAKRCAAEGNWYEQPKSNNNPQRIAEPHTDLPFRPSPQ